MRRNVAVILSGGVGSRLGFSTPKQFLKVAGKAVMEHTVDAFESNAHIDEIAIVSNPFYIAETEALITKNEWRKVKKVLAGGEERFHSSLSAIKAYEGADVNLIFHDAVRPLVSQRILDDVCQALDTYEAVDVATPATDTIISVEGEYIHHIPDRSHLMRGQTPQAFRLSVISEAYKKAMQDEHLRVTDDCGVVARYLPEVPIYVVKGEESNMKLTYKEDTYLLDKFFQLRKSELSNCPVPDGALKDKVVVIFGGNSGIGEQTALLLKKHKARVFCFSRSTNGVDVGDRKQVADALKEVHKKNGRIDSVINTAGVLNKEPLCCSQYETIRNAVNTNYMGAIHVAMESFEFLKETKGKLIFFTSSSYTRGRAFYSIYSSTKAAIVNFMQAIAQEWEPFGICVNCINPERTKTPMRVKNFGIEPDDSLLSAQVVAEATVRSLVSDFTGQVIDVKKNRL